MKLTLEQVRAITCGADHVTREEDGFRFYRFTPEQTELYRLRGEAAYRKVWSTAGICLRFRTDSRFLGLAGRTIDQGGNRRYYSIDVLVNGERVDALDNFTGVKLAVNYTETPLPTGNFEKKVSLGAGQKEICVHLPWNMCTVIREISLDDGAMLESVKPEKKLLCFGDSITQGYDALRPANRYASLLADWLDAEEYNKAIGGEVFFPALANTRERFTPDYITVAYGTNDWRKTTYAAFRENCRQFYENLSRTYPDSRIFAITPIWRKNQVTPQDFPSFGSVEAWIREVAQTLPNVTVLRGYDFVPHDESFFADLTLHPNEKGYAAYFEGLKKAIQTA